MSEQTRVPAGVTTGGRFATSARGEAEVTLFPDAAEMAARRQALVEDTLSADGEGIGHRFEVADLAAGVVHAIDPSAAGDRRAALMQAARESIDAAVAAGSAWACAGEPGPLQHWSDDAEAIIDAALDVTRRANAAEPDARILAAAR
jgi:hypothetical protein